MSERGSLRTYELLEERLTNLVYDLIAEHVTLSELDELLLSSSPGRTLDPNLEAFAQHRVRTRLMPTVDALGIVAPVDPTEVVNGLRDKGEFTEIDAARRTSARWVTVDVGTSDGRCSFWDRIRNVFRRSS